MKILMIAPEPFFEPRGTPFSEYFRIKALAALGHSVDLVTYPFGQDKEIPGLRIFRCWRPPWIKAVKIGPSPAKLILDFFLFFKTLRRLLVGKYDLIHTHEEGNIMGVVCQKMTRIPHLYDMHSSLVQQLDNFQFTRSRIVIRLFRIIENISLKNAAAVIVICRALYDYAAGITAAAKLTMIENFMDDRPAASDPEKLLRLKREVNPDGKKIVMYTGTLESYQGIPLLLDSLNFLNDDFRLVLIGGKASQVEELGRRLQAGGLAKRVLLLGQKSAAEIPYYLQTADILVSPRTLGTNIPLKIYSYLASGVPVVATDLPTHTQTVTPDLAILAAPAAELFAAGIRLAAGPQGWKVAGQAREHCLKHYTRERYLELVAEAVAKAVPAAATTRT
ncbi:MAG: glycosyltransferase [Candidatus Aminicenantes bacterium]|nr:glycosyltransferase [Acidobacteriota bacterium]MCG2810813.1 glycosyltransferase [Candidatus Aminicenantes bacterium]